jgi:group I intron endonuclease
MKSGIYIICNIINGKVYVGQSCNIKHRKECHFSELKRRVHYNEYLQRAFCKHGEKNFEFRVIEETEERLLDDREVFWIIQHKSNHRKFGYNLDSGGNLNHHHSEVSLIKMSEAQRGNKRWLGKHHSEATKRKISEGRTGVKHWDYGKHHSKTHNLKISKALRGRKTWSYGKHLSIETRQKMSNSRMGHYTSEATRLKISKAHIGIGKGTHPSDKTREKMSLALMGNKNAQGKLR